MRTITRLFRWLVTLALAWMVGIVPGCASMGGGGMKYFVDFPSVAAEAIWL